MNALELEPALEGCADFSFSRPLDENPYVRETAPVEWASWRMGWLVASELEQYRGEEERRRWQA